MINNELLIINLYIGASSLNFQGIKCLKKGCAYSAQPFMII